MIQHITNRRTLKRLRGVFRKWLKAGYMARTPVYNVTSRNHAPEINMPPVPLELSAPTLSEREIRAIHETPQSESEAFPLRAITRLALEKHRGRQKRRAVFLEALAQAEALNR